MVPTAYVPPGPAQKLALRAQNPVVRALLRSPAHRLLSGRVLLITYDGRRSGRTFTLPVQYVRDGADVVITVGWPEHKSWWRNFEGDGADVVLRIAGADVRGRARAVVEDGGSVRVRVTPAHG